MKIVASQFQGMRPIVQPMNLSDGQASDCMDCFLHSTGVDPLKSGKTISTGFHNVKALYRIDTSFVLLQERVSVVRSPVIEDKYDRLYFTRDEDKDGGVYVTNHDSFKQDKIKGKPLSGLKPPEHAPKATLLKDNAVSNETIEPDKYTSFRVTYVTEWGEESAPSLASELFSYIDKDNYGVRLSHIPISPHATVSKRRIYMAVDGEYFLRAEIGNTGTTYDLYPLNDDAIQDVLITENFDPPPEGLRGLVGLPNGSMAAFKNEGDDKTGTGMIVFSEPYQPHAYPVGYRHKSQYPVIALAVVPEGVLVLTTGKPMLISGTSPDTMYAQVIESSESCLSPESVLVQSGTAFWASPDGIAAFGGGAVSVISRNVWSREQWQALKPKRMLFAFYENHLLIYADHQAFLYSLGRNDLTRLSQSGVSCTYYDVMDDQLYVVRGDNLEAFNQGDVLEAVWQSKEYVIAGASPFNSLRIEADDYPVTFRLFTEAGEVQSKTIPNNKPTRVKSTGRKRIAYFRLASLARVRLVQLASSMQAVY